MVVGMVTPGGLHTARTGSQNVVIEMAGEYVLATLREVPLIEESTHHFQIKLRGQPIVSVEIPVIAFTSASTASFH